MCLTTHAFVVFLNLIAFDRIETTPDRVIIAADSRPAHWVADGDRWCTMAPQIDAMIRLARS